MRTAALFTILIHTGQAFHTGFNPIQSVAIGGAPLPISSVGFKSLYPTPLFSSSSADDNGESSSTPTLSRAESILDEFHQSNLLFRIIVIGNGAILETTSRLGPTSKSSISPKSGERLLTFASEDASFEFHVKVEQVCKIAFVSTKRRVARFLSENGTPICSLILADSSNEAEEWFDGLVEKHGNEVIM
mmetsp:Transcript_182/g.452  ORF Transcript_182/g.452 Transcript_182/m.452 type:complete len:189 (+) Transcript_182:86-652(+)|eukprot:CAMPEP_0201921106 /NCGR_PEP_ID=MMETSP0903-20130614/9536_1 /ASSEMBLY_ACC=CAM_ASM_000552 /TAXON_ID=420261 /ORGANISM="Thalassiosira antarctica, Strain CCMP982" /LENGTH=188 /DNA_ID=CAMNT_0048458011 /DNA_START=58 /DNA_END=624 /DNA_ORIENTATION=+